MMGQMLGSNPTHQLNLHFYHIFRWMQQVMYDECDVCHSMHCLYEKDNMQASVSIDMLNMRLSSTGQNITRGAGYDI